MPFPFREAFRQKQGGKISWDEYLHILFARCTGNGHEDDNKKFGHWDLSAEDAIGYTIWCCSEQIDRVKGTFGRDWNV